MMECPKGHGAMLPINSLHNPAASEYWCKVCSHTERMPEDIVDSLNKQERIMRAQQGAPRG